jgi:hypothetical protein
LWLAAALVSGSATVACAASTPADDERGPDMFWRWVRENRSSVQEFETYLAKHKVNDVAPTYQLLRTASMWRECKAPPFQVPPAEHWPETVEVLRLLQELRRTGALGSFAVVSAYRDPQLNRCSGGSRGSSHMRFAVDLLPLTPGSEEKLCAFWRGPGKAWDMGMSRYPSGRIHVDRNGWRTWGADHSKGSSLCK